MEYQEQRRERAQQTQRAILQAAMELSRARGFDQVSVRDICRQAGLTTGAFYHHFTSKEDMLVQGFAPLDAYMERCLAGHEGDDPAARLWLILTSYAQFFEDEGPELVGRYYQHRIATPSFASMDPTRFTCRVMLEALRQMEEEGTLEAEHSSEWVAEFFFRHFRGVVIDWVIHSGSYPLLPKLEQDYDFFRHVFRAK